MSSINIPARNQRSPFASMKVHHFGVRVPDFAAARRWYVEKLDFRVVHEWRFADLNVGYLAPASDDTFFVELLGDGQPGPAPKPVYRDLADSLRLGGFHHLCLSIASVDHAAAELRRRDVPLVTEPFEVSEIGRRFAVVADPWGNLIALAQVLG